MPATKENKLRTIEISAEQLPLHSPMSDMMLWKAHPRVY